MGRVKITLVKRTATKIKEKAGSNKTFEENKRMVYGITPSKKIRNKIAGYLVALHRREVKEKREF